MKAVGTVPVNGVFFNLQRKSPWRICSRTWSHSQQIRSQLCPGKHDTFSSCYNSRERTPVLCPQRRLTKGQPFRLIRQCVITQSSGKQRVIDNADVGGQSDLSSDPNKLVLCFVLGPAQRIALETRSAAQE